MNVEKSRHSGIITLLARLCTAAPVNAGLLTLIGLGSVGTARHLSEAGSGRVVGIFAATSPCGVHARPLHGISAADSCDQIKWRLTLYQDTRTAAPTTFRLDGEYGFFVDNQTTKTMALKPGMTGTWAAVRGTKADPNAVVYRLKSDHSGESILLLRVYQAVLHPLNPDKSLMVGTAGASYTLSKIDR